MPELFRCSLLVLEGAESGQEVPIETEVFIGRAHTNELMLSHTAVSRQHARVYREAGKFFVKDLDSTHGTKVNGQPISQHEVEPNDIITVGPLQIKLVYEAVAPVTGGGSVDTKVLLVHTTGPPKSSGAIDSGKTMTGDASARLEAVLQVGLTLQGERSIEALLQRIAYSLIDTLDVDRCGIFVGDGEEPSIVMSRSGVEATESLPFSHTLLNRARTQGEALVTADAGQDRRIAGESIAASAIRSAMVAPLWGREEVLGAVVAENRDRTGAFDSEDLRLLVVLANLAGTAFENTRLIEEVRRETEERTALSRFFSPAVAEQIRAVGLTKAMPNERREITVLFTDIRGFTAMSEQTEPDALIKMLNGYYALLTQAIFAAEGTVDKFTGDGVLALFGAPVAQEDHASRAVRAAEQIRTSCRALHKPDGQPLEIGIGIATGSAVVGPVGDESRMEFTAIGDVVNIASRLVDLAAPGEVLLSENTVIAAGKRNAAESVGERKVKGRTGEVAIYRLLAPPPTHTTRF